MFGKYGILTIISVFFSRQNTKRKRGHLMIIGLVLIAALGALGYAAFNFYMVKSSKKAHPVCKR